MSYDFTTVLNRFNTGSTKWDEMKKYGITDESVIPLSNAEMEFVNAPEIKEGLCDYIRSSVLSYFSPMPSYYDTVISWHKKRYDFRFDRDSIIPNHSIHIGCCLAIEAYTQKGDGIVIMEPVWPGFSGAIKHMERIPVIHVLEEHERQYSINYQSLEKQLSQPENKLLLLCSPHNPVGRVWKKEELEKIAELCCRYEVIIISDEIHADLTMPGYHHIPMASLSPETADITVTFTGASKAFNLAGLDTSNVIITNKKLRDKFKQAKRKFGMSEPNMIGLKACELAYTEGEKWLQECVSVINGNAQYVADYLKNQIPILGCSPLQGSYLMWLDLRGLGMECKRLESELAEKTKLFVDDGYYFGESGSGFIRMNIACPRSVIEVSMGRLKKWIDSLDIKQM